ncbi:uncharacterized protein AB9W97_007741 isoform 2-T2 [Spinachia spinachia]
MMLGGVRTQARLRSHCQMLTMKAGGWVLLSALRLMCASSNDEPNFPNSSRAYSGVCKRQTRSAHLGSSVLLTCTFAPNDSKWVTWAHEAEGDLVQFNSEGRIKFLKPRSGRLKAFPNGGALGNYSILIDALQGPDLGRYDCTRGRSCVEVELRAEAGAASWGAMGSIYASVGVAAFALACIAGLCVKWTSCGCFKTTDNANNLQDAIPAVASAPQEGTSRGPTGQQHSGEGDNNLVYENDDQDPSIKHDYLNWQYCHPIDRPEPERPPPAQGTSGVHPDQLRDGGGRGAKRGFHQEVLNRLRQASRGRHYYANQIEMRRQQATSTQADNPSGAAAVEAGFGRKKKAKKHGAIRNPIYDQSPEQLGLHKYINK